MPGHPVPRPDALGAGLLSAGVAGLTLALVRGEEWGWGSTATLGTLGISAALLTVFVGHCLRARNPLVEPALFRAGGFAGSSIVMTLFSVSFGAMLLSLVLWMQDVWGWSALATGLAVAPGPLMVPLFSFLVAGRLIARFGPAPVVTAGMTIFAVGLGWWAAAVQVEPDYVGALLGGMLLTGIGVGLTLPTLMATAAGSLPPRAFATGSAVVNMLRQVGLALGVALLVALLGTPESSDAALTAFRTGWLVLAAIVARRGRRRCRPASDEGGGTRGGDPHCGSGCTRHAVGTVTRMRTRTFTWEDPEALAAAARDARTGLAFLQAIAAGELPAAPIGRMLGMDIVEIAEGRVVFSLEPTEWMFNPIGTVHGGIAATVLDSCMGCAIHTTLPAGTGYTTSDLQVRYVRSMSVETGLVHAEGTVVHSGRRQATAEGRLSVAATGKLIATATTGCIILAP